ncbi:MAG TPA: hypothetical protein VF681_03805 [Abditibacteriaceae bacterium]|jgi:hypothetical protein
MTSNSPVHSFERELLKPAPRAVVRRANAPKNFRGCIGCFLIPHTLVGLGLIVWLLWAALVTFAGQSVPATIFGRYTSSSDDGPRYFLRYSYDASGQRHENKASVSAAAYDSIPDGSAVTARVVPLLPGVGPQLQINGNKSLPNFSLLGGMALFWNGTVWLFWRSAVFGASGNKYLVSRGVPAVGRILHKRVVTGSYGDTHYVVYEWLPPAGSAPVSPAIGIFTRATLPAAHLSGGAVGASPMVLTDFKPFPQEPNDEEETPTVFLKGDNLAGGLSGAIAEVRAKMQRDKERIEARKTPGALSREESVGLNEWNSVRVGEIVSVLVHPRKASKSLVYKISDWQAQ